MKRKLSERAVWKLMARLFDKADEQGTVLHKYLVCRRDCMCHIIADLGWYDYIDDETQYALNKKIKVTGSKFYPYKYALTKHGAKQRAAFCRRQLEKLK